MKSMREREIAQRIWECCDRLDDVYGFIPFNILLLELEDYCIYNLSLNEIKNGLNELIKKNIIRQIADEYYEVIK